MKMEHGGDSTGERHYGGIERVAGDSEEMESGSCGGWIDVEMEMEMVYYCRDEVCADGMFGKLIVQLAVVMRGPVVGWHTS